jgi:hypothetical protein
MVINETIKKNNMKTIKLNDLLKDQVRQIKNEIDWALQLNDYAKAQELIFEMIKINKQIK